ncbi:single-stranded DNA-binding protein, partial [Staphylococcus aureus]|uniref:single-stranded DNA-binding protein n=1 Tax=Staphylococcus aureus TaxID=1280 RepID=UPI003D1E603D
DFVNCQVWRKSAENFTNFTHKGALVGVQGRIQTRTYDDKDGKKVFVTEVIVDNFALLEPKQVSQNNGIPQRNQSSQTNTNHAQASANNQFANNGKPISVGDSDLPF